MSCGTVRRRTILGRDPESVIDAPEQAEVHLKPTPFISVEIWNDKGWR